MHKGTLIKQMNSLWQIGSLGSRTHPANLTLHRDPEPKSIPKKREWIENYRAHMNSSC